MKTTPPHHATRWLISHNVFYGHHPKTEPDDPHKITADPLFVDPASGAFGLDTLDGYQLKPNSPCIDSGRTIKNHGGRDFRANPVPNPGGTTDRGANEFPFKP